jgi:hypothetical protein
MGWAYDFYGGDKECIQEVGDENLLSSSSLNGLGESAVPASNTVTSPSTLFLVFLCLVYLKDGICRLVVECESVVKYQIGRRRRS